MIFLKMFGIFWDVLDFLRFLEHFGIFEICLLFSSVWAIKRVERNCVMLLLLFSFKDFAMPFFPPCTGETQSGRNDRQNPAAHFVLQIKDPCI